MPASGISGHVSSRPWEKPPAGAREDFRRPAAVRLPRPGRGRPPALRIPAAHGNGTRQRFAVLTYRARLSAPAPPYGGLVKAASPSSSSCLQGHGYRSSFRRQDSRGKAPRPRFNFRRPRSRPPAPLSASRMPGKPIRPGYCFRRVRSGPPSPAGACLPAGMPQTRKPPAGLKHPEARPGPETPLQRGQAAQGGCLASPGPGLKARHALSPAADFPRPSPFTGLRPPAGSLVPPCGAPRPEASSGPRPHDSRNAHCLPAAPMALAPQKPAR
jgi:hypothetical protein